VETLSLPLVDLIMWSLVEIWVAPYGDVRGGLVGDTIHRVGLEPCQRVLD
jgi:hypothetical protein